MLIIFTVNDQKVTHDLGQRTLVAGSSGVVKAAFTFDNSWDGLDVVVVFSNSGKKCNNKPIKYDGVPSPQEAQPNTIYFVLQNNAGAGNQYIEYMLINGALEAIGYGNADLSGYVTEDYVAKADDSLMEDIFNQTSPIQEKYVGTGNLVSFWGLTKDLLDEMEAVQNDLASDIELLELCVTNRPVEGNPFVVTFETLNNLDVEGVWETANKRISF